MEPACVSIEVPGGTLSCHIMGEGPPIVMLHGGPGMTHDYLVQGLKRLAESYTLFFFDQRGCGLSRDETMTSETVNLATYVQDIEVLRAHFGLEKIMVLGHSWGGFLAMHYAATYPERVEKLILVGPLPMSYEGCVAFEAECVKRLASYQKELEMVSMSPTYAAGEPEVVEQYYRILFRIYFHNAKRVQELELHVRDRETVMRWRTVEEIFTKTFFAEPFDVHHNLKNITARTLFVHGDFDPIVPTFVETMSRLVANSEYVLIKKCGHFPWLEQPRAFFAAVLTFLKKGD
ncbi:MAG: proline iminopeptidase [Candidatus Dependentiae bacterium]|nr:proline iminopeptidase [Candidatus Dependentiae bacterium]